MQNMIPKQSFWTLYMLNLYSKVLISQPSLERLLKALKAKFGPCWTRFSETPDLCHARAGVPPEKLIPKSVSEPLADFGIHFTGGG